MAIPGVTATPPVPATNEHGAHSPGGGTPPQGGVPPFADTLAQAVARSPAGGGHGGHGVGASQVGGGQATLHSSPAASSTEKPHPAHFQIGTGGHGGQHDFQEIALGLRAYRQQMIAANIANADTPNYKATDIDFQEALRVAQTAARAAPLNVALSHPGHVSGRATAPAIDYPVLYHVPSQASVDGNTVDMDVERAKFAENSVMYEFTLDRAKGHSMMMLEMFKNLR